MKYFVTHCSEVLDDCGYDSIQEAYQAAVDYYDNSDLEDISIIKGDYVKFEVTRTVKEVTTLKEKR